MKLFDKNYHFNLANIITFANITCGILGIYFIVERNFFIAIILAWIGGGFDIADGKVARKYNLSTEFGVQLDSFADFLSFVVMPSFLVFYAIKKFSIIDEIIIGVIFIFYIISGLRRLIEFNLKTDAGGVDKFFEGVPTPLGAILLWILYLLYSYDLVTNIYIVFIIILSIAISLNSKLKIPHP